MLECGTLRQARATRQPRTLRTGEPAWVGVVVGPAFGTLPAQGPAPQCFLVDQSAGSTVLPHFHPCDQFQLVVEGSGRIGAHAVQPYSVHYARRDTGYGPVVAGTEGLSYLSIRAEASWQTHYLPEAKDRLGPGPRMNLFAPAVAGLAAASLRELRDMQRQVLLVRAGCGELAWLVAAPAGQDVHVDPAGRVLFGLVLAGQLQGKGVALEQGACLCLHGESEPLRFTAGAGGAQVLCMRFPSPAEP